MKNGKVTIATHTHENPVLVDVECKVEVKGNLTIHRPLRKCSDSGKWVETSTAWNITAPNGFEILRCGKIYLARKKAAQLLALNVNWTDEDSSNYCQNFKVEIMEIRGY